MADATDPQLDVLSDSGDRPTSEAQDELLAGMEIYRTVLVCDSLSEAWNAVSGLNERDARRTLLAAVLTEISRRRQPI